MNGMCCPYCERRCDLSEGTTGYCGMYTVRAGRVVERYARRYSSIQVAHIESVPFFHFSPGSRTLILGGAGCTFDCHYCSNAYVARSDPEGLLDYELSPERIVKFAHDYGCHNIGYAVNEPTVAMPTLLTVADAAHAAGLEMVALTNGFTQPEATRQMGRAFDGVNVSIKGLDDAFYREHVGFARANGGEPPAEIVRRNIATLHDLTHVEVSTPIIQGVNDQDIDEIAMSLSTIDRGLPWHVFRLLPEYKMAGYERPSIGSIVEALAEARHMLDYVYFSNFVGSRWVSTRCPTCNALAIERLNLSGCSSKAVRYALDERLCCGRCGAGLGIAGAAVTWHSKDDIA